MPTGFDRSAQLSHFVLLPASCGLLVNGHVSAGAKLLTSLGQIRSNWFTAALCALFQQMLQAQNRSEHSRANFAAHRDGEDLAVASANAANAASSAAAASSCEETPLLLPFIGLP